jgi:sec-independent protein translocase protein TatA
VGISELIVILLILIVVFGASRLPQLGESMGRTIRNFKRGMDTDESIQIAKPPPPAKSNVDKIDEAEVLDRKS